MALIGLDLDGVVADLHGSWLDWYNAKWHDNLQKCDLRWELKSIVKPKCGAHIYDYLRIPDIYDNIQPHTGAVEGVRRIVEMKHDLIIVTHPMGGSATINNKQQWIDRYLPFGLDVIYSGRKEIMKFDIFIDDSPTNIVPYRKAWPKGKILTIAWPYNKNCKKLVNLRAKSYRDTEHAWQEITQYIERYG